MFCKLYILIETLNQRSSLTFLIWSDHQVEQTCWMEISSISKKKSFKVVHYFIKKQDVFFNHILIFLTHFLLEELDLQFVEPVGEGTELLLADMLNITFLRWVYILVFTMWNKLELHCFKDKLTSLRQIKFLIRKSCIKERKSECQFFNVCEFVLSKVKSYNSGREIEWGGNKLLTNKLETKLYDKRMIGWNTDWAWLVVITMLLHFS